MLSQCRDGRLAALRPSSREHPKHVHGVLTGWPGPSTTPQFRRHRSAPEGRELADGVSAGERAQEKRGKRGHQIVAVAADATSKPFSW